MKSLIQSLRLLGALTLVTGLAYPLLIWAIAHTVFPHQASGSLVHVGDRLIGSELLAQRQPSPAHFQPRASSAAYATLPSGAGNQAWSSRTLQASIQARAADYPGRIAPSDLLTASASGLDPHLSPEAVRLQAERIARVRGLDERARMQLDDLIAEHTEGGQFGPARVNILRLNLALDSAFRQ